LTRANIILTAAVIILILLLGVTCGSLSGKKQEVNAYEALNAVLEISVDRKGREVAKRDAIIVQSEKDLLNMKAFNDSTFLSLQNIVRKAKGTVIGAAIIDNTTEFNITVPTRRDTVEAIVTYTGMFKDPWVEWTGSADPDSFNIHVITDNRYEYEVSKINPVFKKAKVIATVRNMSPYTRTNEFISFQVDAPDPRFIIGVGAQYGIDIVDMKTMRFTVGPNLTWRIAKVK